MTLPASVFCNPFDAALAAGGVPAVFLLDREGLLRFDETWTRDAWGRWADREGLTGVAGAPLSEEPVAPGWSPAWALVRDRGTGFVSLVYVTAAALLEDHPRADVRPFDSRDAAEAARAAFGTPPLAPLPW